MSSPPRKDIASLVRGLSFTHQPAVDTSSTQQGGKKEKIGDDLMDFSSIVDASESVSKDPPVETGIKRPSIGRVKETIFTNPSTSDNLMSGTSDAVSLSSVDKKKYKLFCAPSRTSGCDQLCRQFIGQGSTICINVDCKTVHRGRTREKANVDMDQLFVLKSKGVVFSEPTVTALVNPKLLETWMSEHKTLSEWVEVFSLANKSTYGGIEVKTDFFNKAKEKQEKAKQYVTPARKRVRDTLEEDEPWEFSGFEMDLDVDQKWASVQTALLENQKEHGQFRSVHLELEDAVQDVSFAQEYNSEHLKLKIGKKPKCLLDKYDGPDLYSTIGIIAAEVNDIPNSVQSKIDSKKASVQVDFDKFK